MLAETVEQFRLIKFIEENFFIPNFKIEFPNDYQAVLTDEKKNKIKIQNKAGEFVFDYEINEMPF